MFGSIVPTGFRGLDSILSWRDSRPGWDIMPTLTIKTQRIFIVAMQHSNMAIIWQLCAPNALSLFCCLLAGAPASAASLTFSQHHIAVLPLCVWAGYCCLQSKNKPKKPHRANPQTPLLALHSQDKAHTMELLLHLESSRAFAWCFVLFSSVTVLLWEEKWIFVFAALGMPLVGWWKRIKVASELMQLQTKPSLFPLLQPPSCPSHSSCNLSSY